MRRRGLYLLFVFVWLVFPLLSQNSGEYIGFDGLIQSIQAAANNHDIESFLEFFRLDLREAEEAKLLNMLKDFHMKRVSLHKAYTEALGENRALLFLRAMFENDYSAIIEMWRLTLARGESGWKIDGKQVAESIQMMYKIVIPSERMTRARRVEISHTDIQIVFEEATVFFDNLPKKETALLVTGKGRLVFSPSLPREQHQLDLLFGADVLTDQLKYVYIRCSDSFFSRNIRITEETERAEPITKPEMNRASSLFLKHYSRSFTIENSLDGRLLSFMPQGDEVIFEFEGNKIGDYSYIYSPFAEEEINFFRWREKRIVNLYSPQVSDGEKSLFISIGQKFDITDYEVAINYRPKDSFLSGRARIFVDSEIGSFDVLKFRLNSNLQILRINDEKKQTLFYTVDKLREALYVYLPFSPQKDKSALVEIYYRGIVEPDTTVTDMDSAQYNETYSMIPNRFETYLYTQSSHWYPAPADDDYFTATLRITVPPGYSVVSNGILEDKYEIKSLESVEDVERVGSMVCVYKTSRPVKYLSFIAGRFITVEEEKQPLPIQYIKAYNVRGQKRDYLGEAKEILTFFSSIFGDYPYEKFSIVHRLWPREGGHSPPSFVVINEMPRVPAGYSRRVSHSPIDLSRWKEYYLAHEIAHQWWGQSVTWNSYHDQWLSEGLAQFAAVLYLEKKYGKRILPWVFGKFSSWILSESRWGAITMGSRISYFDFNAFQSTVYNKTTLVLFMLKDYLGEDVFFKALKNFMHNKRFSPAKTEEFISVFERVSGKDLSQFFDKWFNSHLLPDVMVQHSVQKSGGASLLTLRIIQTKGPFVFPLWVEWKEGRGKRREKILVDRRIQEFSFQVLDKPKGISINPEDAVPGFFR